jgi:hypothetical protein
MLRNQQIVLDNRPQGEAVASNFKRVAPPRSRMARCWCATITCASTPPRAAA